MKTNKLYKGSGTDPAWFIANLCLLELIYSVKMVQKKINPNPTSLHTKGKIFIEYQMYAIPKRTEGAEERCYQVY